MVVFVHAARGAGWRNGAAREAGLIYLVYIIPVPAPGDEEVVSQVRPLHAKVAEVYGLGETVRHGELTMLELDRRLELALAGHAMRMGEKFDPALLASALDPLVAVLVDSQEIVPQLSIGFRHLIDRLHVGELLLELAELFFMIIILMCLREGRGSIMISQVRDYYYCY